MRERGEKVVLGVIRGFCDPSGSVGGSIQTRIFDCDRHLTGHNLRKQEIGTVILACRFRNYKCEGPRHVIAADEGHDHPRLRAQLMKDAELVSVLRRHQEVALRNLGHENGLARTDGGRHPAG